MSMFKNNFITTFSGLKFHFLDPQEDEISLRDIAHQLSLKCRFSGACKEFYSVAEHSIWVWMITPGAYALEALFHDSAEAYMPDVARPIKEQFGLREYEHKILKVIYKKFGIPTFESKEVKYSDDVMIATEARDLMVNTTDWAELPEPLDRTVIPIRDMGKAERLFYETATKLIRS